MTQTTEPKTDNRAERFKGGFGRGAFRAERAAAYLDVSRDTFDRWNAGGKVPRPIRKGGINLWPRADLDEWIAAGMPDRSAWEAIRAAHRN